MPSLFVELQERAGQGSGAAPPSARVASWLTEVSDLRASLIAAGWDFDQVHPQLGRLIQGRPAGDGWVIDLRLLAQRWPDRAPISARLIARLHAQARRRSPAHLFSSDQ